MTLVLAIDPGTTQSGVCLFTDGRVVESGVHENRAVRDIVRASTADMLAIEMVASYGMAVGKEVFETCVWIGRFAEKWRAPDDVLLVYRKDVKMFLCGNTRAKETNIRQALIDLLGAPGVKAHPGPTYGVRSHAWSALAVAVTATQYAPMHGVRAA